MKFAVLIAAATLAANAASAQQLNAWQHSEQPSMIHVMPPAPTYQPWQAYQPGHQSTTLPPAQPGPVLVVPHGGGYYSFIH